MPVKIELVPTEKTETYYGRPRRVIERVVSNGKYTLVMPASRRKQERTFYEAGIDIQYSKKRRQDKLDCVRNGTSYRDHWRGYEQKTKYARHGIAFRNHEGQPDNNLPSLFRIPHKDFRESAKDQVYGEMFRDAAYKKRSAKERKEQIHFTPTQVQFLCALSDLEDSSPIRVKNRQITERQPVVSELSALTGFHPMQFASTLSDLSKRGFVQVRGATCAKLHKDANRAVMESAQTGEPIAKVWTRSLCVVAGRENPQGLKVATAPVRLTKLGLGVIAELNKA
jgi:hypothetical protein